MDVFGGSHSDSKTMTTVLDTTRGDLGCSSNHNDNDGDCAKKINSVHGKNSMSNDDDATKHTDKTPANHRSRHSDSDVFLDDEEESLFPLTRCESQSLLESMEKELQLVFDTEHFGKVDLGISCVYTCDKVIMGSDDDKVVLLTSEDYEETLLILYSFFIILTG